MSQDRDAQEGIQRIVETSLDKLIERVFIALPIDCDAYRQDRIDLLGSWFRFLAALVANHSPLCFTTPQCLPLLPQVFQAAKLCLDLSRPTRKPALTFLSKLRATWLGERASYANENEVKAGQMLQQYLEQIDPSTRA
eukprot:CAMPEP_0167770608 /NCGR_PEP_ID=MMETSP0110_2-20121227/18030_1 /TAXON_ID=629695 /ORGANISM="Gymnochlora sp., Strain CCMP2014" /LENGTH=137 /DNA_ID=CAMNT_0007659837 /DNA_START=1756 /DNA_END=2166 /DNA_ORIENTATION=+